MGREENWGMKIVKNLMQYSNRILMKFWDNCEEDREKQPEEEIWRLTCIFLTSDQEEEI